jgi:hypothetical protein
MSAKPAVHAAALPPRFRQNIGPAQTCSLASPDRTLSQREPSATQHASAAAISDIADRSASRSVQAKLYMRRRCEGEPSTGLKSYYQTRGQRAVRS